ncbi:chlorophyll synthesis pathway protein BchC [Chenggangzhangella methanolivorans]|uniref:Chlorophyll synthesis pathway protein BchC n=1 Tax=Chenggangzhangella methanolivorans TaxID=1437009 RepID=A0A9E6ULF3_9HYPH|nr:chlorophyll synthesis pathway protein BchC [Chenggangzhangella methanolivorans]QZO00482.1 chlorophyll synthesis pathway protein BchC [Chenggangzhangella methanolivorans]
MSLAATAVVLDEPGRISVRGLALTAPRAGDVVVETAFSGVSTGTERLLWNGSMPPFPGMGYPLVPGYEAVGEIVEAGPESGRRVGETVFVPGAKCFGEIRGLFGAAAGALVTPGARVAPVEPALGESAALLALAATAHHAFAGHAQPELIVGHGVLGRLVARIAVALGAEPPIVWEKLPARRPGADGYLVIDPENDPRRDYRVICDASGDSLLTDALIQRLAPGGEIVLAGFYETRVSFAFPPAFMREARLRVAAEWKPADLAAVTALTASGRLSLENLVTHRAPAREAADAYRTAFEDPSCLKMIIDWKGTA